MIIIIAEKNNQISPHEHGRKLLFDLLKKLYPQVTDFPISKNENGKPFIQNIPEFHFNISHSGEWTVLAVSDVEVGVDIQIIKSVNSNISKRFFTRRENNILEKLEKENFFTEFTRMWTIKEARTKASGDSLAKCLSRFNTIEYDGTTSTFIDGYYVMNIPFPDEKYILAVSSLSVISDNYFLKIR